jgi:hypothetical protein
VTIGLQTIGAVLYKEVHFKAWSETLFVPSDRMVIKMMAAGNLHNNMIQN